MWKIKTNAFHWLAVAVLVTVFGVILTPGDSHAATGINSQVSFQGKLVNTNGTNIADGTYNLQFKIYQDGTSTGSGGTLKWTESRLISASQGVTVTAGTFQVNLGSVTALSGIDFNQDTLWLSMNVGGTGNTAVWDGEMTPFIRLTAVPYAINAGAVGGLSASQLVQLTPAAGTQTGTVNVTGNITSTTGTLGGATLSVSGLGTTGALSVASTTTPSGGVGYFNGNVGIGTSNIIGQLQLESATYRSNQLLLNNGVTGTPPAYPNGYLPSLSVISSQTSASRPLFFGYSNAGAYSAFLTSGACGSFSQMCLDMGSGTTAYTALENIGNILKVGGGDDGNFSYVNLQGNVGVGNSNSPSLFSVGASSQFQVSSAGAVTAAGINSGTGLIQGSGGLTVSGTTTLSSLTAGSVPFIATGGVVSQNNAKFFYDNTNNRLGIGTNSPTSTLTVANAGQAGIQLLTTTANAELDLTFTNNAGSTLTGLAGSNGNILDNSVANDYVFNNRAGAGILFSADTAHARRDLYIASNGAVSLGSLTTAGVLLNNGSGVVSSLADVAIGSCLISNGVGIAPVWGSCSSSSGANAALSNLSGVAINTSLLPGSDNLIDLGSSTTSFRTAYVDTTVYTPQVDSWTAGGTLSLGNTNATTINVGPVGTTANAANTNVATSTGAAQALRLGGTGASGGSNSGTTTILQGGNSILLVQNSGVNVQTYTNTATAFQVQNSAGASVLSVDTTSTAANGNQLNYLTYPGFESGSFSSASAGWAATSGATLTQNTARTLTYNGQYSAQVVATASGAGLTTGSFIGVPASGTYIISFYARVSTGTMLGNLFTVTSTDGTTHACTMSTGYPTITATGFQRIYCSITTTGALTALSITQSDATSRTFYIDAVQVQSNSFNGTTITAPTPYQIGAIQLRGVITNPLTLINNGDSTTAFQIQNAVGTTNTLVADTLNTRVGIGLTGSPAATLSVGGTTGNFNVTAAGVVTGGTYNGVTLSTTVLTLAGAATVSSGANTLAIGNTSTTNLTLVGPTYTTSTKGVQIGSATAAANPTLLLLNQGSVASGSETAGTCSATVNLGALYYNTSTNAVRSCINGAWEDLVSTSGLGVLAFGVVPDSGTTPGDMLSMGGTAHTSGPCKVYWTSATSISVAPCVAYSAGRKVIVSTATAITLTNATAGNYQHICFATAAGVASNTPAALTSSTEAAGMPAFSLGNPILCVADVYYAGANNTVSAIYDTRVFTTTTKEFDLTSSAVGLGYPACYGTSTGVLAACGTGGAVSVAGIVVASNGATSSTSPNIIIATGGPTNAKAVLTGNVAGDVVQTSTTANRLTATVLPTGTLGTSFDSNLGVNRISSPATACATTASVANCDYQFFFSQQKR